MSLKSFKYALVRGKEYEEEQGPTPAVGGLELTCVTYSKILALKNVQI